MSLTLKQYVYHELSARGYLDEVIREALARVVCRPGFAPLQDLMHFHAPSFPLPLVNRIIEALIHEADIIDSYSVSIKGELPWL